MSVRDTINRILDARQGDVGNPAAVQTITELAYDLPENPKAKGDLDADKAAKKVKLDDERSVLSYHVRQAVDADGEGSGQKYLVVIDDHAGKHVVKL